MSTHNRKLWVATGQGNLGIIRQQHLSWPDYVEWLRKQYAALPVSATQYASLSPDEKHALKKRLPFSLGAKYQGTARKAEAVECRETLNIDVDKQDPETYKAVLEAALGLGVAFLHVGSSSNEVNGKRSGRLIFPLNRSVEPRKEFPSVSRKIAEKLGIEAVDPVSHRVNQVCYVPARNSDASEVFELVDGPWLDAGKILAEYRDWQDPAEWPRAECELAVYSETSRLGDPRTKPGSIGAFCRKFDFLEAIETFHLPYEPTSDERRWTPHGATSAGGARIYGTPDDADYAAWMYSEHLHGLSPKRNVNAYDAVRLHKFGHLDDPKTPDDRTRSERSMSEFIAAEYPDVAADAQRQAVTDEAFENLDASDYSWMDEQPTAAPNETSEATQPTTIHYVHGCAQLKATELLDALKVHGPALGLYTMAGRIVEAKRGANGGPVEFIALNSDAFTSRLRGRIQFAKKMKDGSRITACPPELCRAVFGLVHELMPIEIWSVAHAPLWRDGKLAGKPGFDPESHVWVDAPQISLPSVCDKAAAASARDYLLSWISEFAFVSPQDRAVALAALVSAAVRASIRCPAYSITKPSFGAGASCLCDLAHVILTGETAPVFNGGGSREEIDKEINAAQLAGRPSLVADNISPGIAFNSTAMVQAISQATRTIRWLGKSEAPTVQCSQMVWLNGINLRLADDLVRRCLPIELDPMLENPESRVFKRKNLIEDAKRDRVKMLTAAFTIVAAYAASGEHVPVQTIAGFDPWCRTVGAALRWLGEPDLATSQRKLKADDPASNLLRTLANACRALFGVQSFTVAQLVMEASSSIHDETGSERERQRHAEARIALEQLLEELAPGRRGSSVSNAVGLFLRKNKKRVIDGFQLEAAVGHKNTSRWRFREIRPNGDSREARNDQTAPAPRPSAPAAKPIAAAASTDAPAIVPAERAAETSKSAITEKPDAAEEWADSTPPAAGVATDSLWDDPADAPGDPDSERESAMVGSAADDERDAETLRNEVELDDDEAEWFVDRDLRDAASIADADFEPMIQKFGELRAASIKARAEACMS